MAGKFINTKKQDIINDSVQSIKNKLENNNFAFMTNEKPSLVTYYNINEELSTLDYEGSQDAYEILGKNSPLRFNKINNLPIGGMDKIIASIELSDMGVEGSDISGEITIYPDTIKAHTNDIFVIEYLKEKLVFKVTEVQYDTLDNGSNYNRIQYVLYGNRDKYKYLDKQTVEVYNTIIDNIGSDFKVIIKSEYYDLIEKWQDASNILKKYFKMIFYNNKVQTFIYTSKVNGVNFYDPYIIEFLSKHKILSGDGEYVQVMQQCSLPQTFGIDYDRCILRCVEKKDKENINNYAYFVVGEIIKDITSIFNTRIEDYYKIIYKFPEEMTMYRPMNVVEADLIRRINTNEYYTKSNNLYLNIIIKFFNDTDLTLDDLKSLDNIKYDNDILLLYYIPIIIYAIEEYIRQLLVKHVNK